MKLVTDSGKLIQIWLKLALKSELYFEITIFYLLCIRNLDLNYFPLCDMVNIF